MGVQLIAQQSPVGQQQVQQQALQIQIKLGALAATLLRVTWPRGVVHRLAAAP